jgi:hypothetical protein
MSPSRCFSFNWVGDGGWVGDLEKKTFLQGLLEILNID